MFKQVLKIGLGLSLVASSLLAAPEKTKLKIGFIALTDCAPLVIAKEKGFFAAEGLDVDVEKEGGGWPGIQQKTISGEYDFAHALAGLPIAATLGINGDANLQVLLSLDYNGNAITLSNKSKYIKLSKSAIPFIKRKNISVSESVSLSISSTTIKIFDSKSLR